MARAEPPGLQDLTCVVVQQEGGGGIRLRVRFENNGETPIELPPGPHLIPYADSAATERMDLAGRMDRIQRTPIVVPPGGSTEELFAIEESFISSLRCGDAKPAATAMYFYKFSQRPQFRCLLRGFEAPSKVSCPSIDAQMRGEPQ